MKMELFSYLVILISFLFNVILFVLKFQGRCNTVLESRFLHDFNFTHWYRCVSPLMVVFLVGVLIDCAFSMCLRFIVDRLAAPICLHKVCLQTYSIFLLSVCSFNVFFYLQDI